MSKANKQQVPKIRFEGFSGDWNKKKLKELVSFSKGKSYSKSSLVDEGNPIILYGSLYTDYKSNINNVTTFAIPLENSIYSEGDEILLPSSGESDVDIARASAVTQKGVLLGGDLNVLKPKKDLNNIFMALNLTYSSVNSSLVKRAQGQVVVHLYNSDIQNLKISFPSLEEQTQISNFYQEVDKLIDLQSRAVESAEMYKKAMLQKMFPQKGEKVPRVRFAGFSGDWYFDIINNIVSNVNLKDYLISADLIGKFPVIQQGDSPIAGYSDHEPYQDYEDIVLFGDHTLSLYKPKEPFLISTDGVKALKAPELNSYYFYFLLENYKPVSEGYKRHFTILRSIVVGFPSPEEQVLIGNYFQKLDQNIESEKKKLEQYQTMKRAMLQRMFV